MYIYSGKLVENFSHDKSTVQLLGSRKVYLKDSSSFWGEIREVDLSPSDHPPHPNCEKNAPKWQDPHLSPLDI